MEERQQDFTQADIAWWQNRAAHYTRAGNVELARRSAHTAQRLRENATQGTAGGTTHDGESR